MLTLKQRLISLLRFSERYTQLDMLYVAKGGFWTSFGQIVPAVLSLLLVIAFANLLPKETYGTYRYILSLAGVLNIFTLTGMNSSVAREVAAGHEGALSAAVRYQLKWNLLMLVAFWSLAAYYFFQSDSLFATAFFLLGIFVPPTLALNTYGAYLDGKRLFKWSSIANVFSTLIYAAGTLTIILTGGNVLWLIAAYAGTTFLATLFFYVHVTRAFKPLNSEAGGTLAYGRQLTFIGFMEPVAAQLDKIILAHFWGPAQLAVYALATAIPNRATSLVKSWVNLGLPKFSVKTREELNLMFYKRIFQGVLFGTLTATAYILAAPYLFAYLLPQYLDSIAYSQILALSLVFAMPNRYLSLLLVSQKLSRRIFASGVAQLFIRIALYIILGIWGGIMGLIYAQVILSFLSLLTSIGIWKIKRPE